MPAIQRGIAIPNFGADPGAIAELAVAAEAADFDGFFLWDHLLFANDGNGPQILDPWAILAVIAARTQRIRIGTMVTPISRRRPWDLARQTTTIDLLSNGRMILGVGLGSPAKGDFADFGEVSADRDRAALLDEGLDLLTGFWSGEPVNHQGPRYRVAPVRFVPTPVQRPRIPIWVGGVLPAPRPLRRAARWDGVVPIRFAESQVVRPSIADIRGVTRGIEAARDGAGRSMDGYDVVVWSQIAADDAAWREVPQLRQDYRSAGATWWIETGRPGPRWFEEVADRIRRGA